MNGLKDRGLRPSWRIGLYFFRFDVAKGVVPEFPGAAEELLLRAGERDMRGELELQKVKGAYEIGDLKQPVARGFYFGSEFDSTVEVCLEDLMKKPSDGCLSAVVVDLYAIDRRKRIVTRGDEFCERHLESVDNLVRGIDIPFVDGETMIFVVDLSGKSHHAGEYPSAQLAAQHGVVLFAADEGAGMEAVTLKSDLAVRTLKFGNLGRDVDGLVVKNHAYDVEAGLTVRQFEVARLVNKDTQGSFAHGLSNKKREWRDANLATHAESFPRIPVTPAVRRRSGRILANCRAWRKGEREIK